MHNYSRGSQIIFFIGGILLGVLNKMRHLIFGYLRPRGISVHQISENIEYDQRVANTIENRLKAYTHKHQPLLNTRIMEIGPGQDLGTGIIFLAKGAHSYVAIDRFALAQKDQKFYTALGEHIENEIGSENTRQTHDALKICVRDVQSKELPFFEYHAPITDLDVFKGHNQKMFNIITSQSVLHTMDDIDQFFQESYELLDNGGIMCHEIDMRVMMNVFRHTDPLNILRYGQKLYDRLIHYPGAPNRLRSSDYVTSAKKVGFKNIKFQPLIVMKSGDVKKVVPHINKSFQMDNKETLAHLTGVLYGQK